MTFGLVGQEGTAGELPRAFRERLLSPSVCECPPEIGGVSTQLANNSPELLLLTFEAVKWNGEVLGYAKLLSRLSTAFHNSPLSHGHFLSGSPCPTIEALLHAFCRLQRRA